MVVVGVALGNVEHRVIAQRGLQLSQLSPDLQNDPLFNVPKSYTDNYHYILNVSPQVVEARTQIFSEFKAA